MTTNEVAPVQGCLNAAAKSGNLVVAHVAVFCGTGNLGSEYVEPSLELIDMIGGAGLGIIYGVAKVGLMREVAARAREKDVHITGVAIENSKYPEGPADRLITMPKTSARVDKILELADGVAVLPGGVGTTHEAVTTFEAMLASEFNGPVAVLNIAGNYTFLQQHYSHLATVGGFLRRPLDGAGVLYTQSPAEAYAHIANNIGVLNEG